jgi:hypothetical protein
MTQHSFFSSAPAAAAFLASQGYTDVREAGPSICALQRFNFTTGLVVGLGAEGYERRYCYEHEADARDALLAWDGSGHPSGPWIKCKGAGMDLLNPELRA